jgi:mitochondrial fission protein ELM1
MESLKGKPYLKLCIIANRDNPVGAYEAILHLSQKILVTSDSISMISEALTYGKEVLILKGFKPLKSKHEMFIRDLVQSGLAKLVEEGNLSPQVLEAKGSKANFDNIAEIKKALVNIL